MGRVATKQARRRHILAAATAVFAAKGYDKTSMEDVRAACEVSKGTLYLYFASKEALFSAVAATFFDELTRQWEADSGAREALPTSDQLQTFLRLMTGALRQGKPHHGLYADFFVQAWQSDAVRQVLLVAYTRTITLLEQLLQHGMTAGEFCAVDAQATARVILGALDGILLQKLLDADADITATLDQLITMTMTMLRADPRAEGHS